MFKLGLVIHSFRRKGFQAPDQFVGGGHHTDACGVKLLASACKPRQLSSDEMWKIMASTAQPPGEDGMFI